MLPQHVALALELVVVEAVEEVNLFLVDRLEIAAVLEVLCLMNSSCSHDYTLSACRRWRLLLSIIRSN